MTKTQERGNYRIEVTTLGDLLLKAADRAPENDAVIFPNRRHTYASLSEAAYTQARRLMAMGIKRGDHVGILAPNFMEFVELIFGCALAGAVSVPINARFKAHEMGYVIENADLVALFTTDIISEYADFAGVLTRAFPDLEAGQDPDHLQLKDAPKLKRLIMLGESTPPGFTSRADYEALESGASNADVDERRIAVSLREPCIMMYTSGTTANPKGCPITNEQLVRNGINMNREKYLMGPEDVMWDPLPMFHMAAILPMVALFDAGATMISQTHFEPGEALRLMEQEKATIAFPAFPTITAALINHPDFEKTDLSRIRRMNNVAPPDTLKQFAKAFPQAVQTSAYGLTECGGVISFGREDDPEEERLNACGIPFSGLEVKIVDPETGEDLPQGERGEIIARGYAVFDGYYKDPEKTAASIKDGWLHTGDLCSLDEYGQIRFHGRLKDMLKIGGENVAAVEIESYLSNHPAIKLAQVVGVPDPKLEEVAAAFIELKPGQELSEQEVIDFCKGQIASFKVPRHVRFVTDWPMSSTKIQKFALKEQLTEELQNERKAG
ncbi:MAG: AMP-binding protein [Alphaproteobacteria bacterium]|nr:AMP-binding protein [Alphaproteobacteria bacterium]